MMKLVAVKSLSVSVSTAAGEIQKFILCSVWSQERCLCGQYLYYVHINSAGYNRKEVLFNAFAFKSR